jgi:hypothetical protein
VDPDLVLVGGAARRVHLVEGGQAGTLQAQLCGDLLGGDAEQRLVERDRARYVGDASRPLDLPVSSPQAVTDDEQLVASREYQ